MMEIYTLLIDAPYLPKGRFFHFDIENGYVYWEDKNKVVETPLRTGLAGYLWLLKGSKHMRRLKKREKRFY